MYKYQKEVIKEIDKAIDKIEPMTEEKYRIQIGYREENDFEYTKVPLFVCINGKYRYEEQTANDYAYDVYSKCYICDCNKVTLNKNIFVEINELLDKVIKDNKKREEFYKVLNAQLQAFNKSLETL